METKNGASENSETKQNQPHNHHFIPQFYLRHFATPDTRKKGKKRQKIYVIDKLHRRFEDEPRLIKRVGSENDYNAFRINENQEDCETVEHELNRIEDMQSNLLERIKTQKSIENVDKRELASLVAWMHCRAPFIKRLMKKIYEEARAQFSKRSFLFSTVKIPVPNDPYENNQLINLNYLEALNGYFLDALCTFRYALIEIPKESKKFFITSDNPVSIICREKQPATYFVFISLPTDEKYSFWFEMRCVQNYAIFESKASELLLPIDRKLCLWLTHNDSVPHGNHFVCPKEDIDEYNVASILNADKEIYAPEITDELKILIKSRWDSMNTFQIDTTQFTQDACDFFMRNVCNVKSKYTTEDLAREIKDKKLFCFMRIFQHPIGTKNNIEYCVSPKPIYSTHQVALSEANRPFWAQKLKTNKLIVFFVPLQTDGIGSHGRKWVSDKEDFHVNLIFYADQILPFSQIAAYTACQLLARETMQTERFKIKWPNDVMVEDWSGAFKKIGGCLTEVRKEGSLYWVTVGIGINYNLEDFSNIDQQTASVKSFLNSFPKKCGLYRENDFTKDELFQSVQRFADLFLKNLALVQYNDLAAFYNEEDWKYRFGSKNYWLYLGQKITVFDEDKQMRLTGRFDKLTDDGALRLVCDDGKTEIVLNGTGLKLAKNC